MDPVWSQLALVAVLVLANALFAGTEMALVSLRDSQVGQLRTRGRAGETLARLVRDPNTFLATIQVGITLAGFLASATAAVSLAEPVEPLIEPVFGGASRPVAIVAVTVVLTFVTLVFGELAPKRIAMQRAERWSLVAARPLAGLAVLTRPVVWLLSVTSDLVVRAVGADPEQQRKDITEEELRDMVAAQPELSEEERRIIAGAFEFADRSLREIFVPRPMLVALTADTDVVEAAQRLAETGHTRAPVYGDTLDNVLGTVHLRALIGAEGTVRRHALDALILPETVGCLTALRRMQSERQQMAIVIDEYGATVGLVTVEDIMEELVGEIWDETDPDVQAVQRRADGSLVLWGAYPIHDLDDIGVDLPTGDYTTVAGLVMAQLHRVPEAGETLTVEGWTLTVEDATERTVRRVSLAPAAETTSADGSRAEL